MPHAYVRSCPRCDAPLPTTASADGAVTCRYCGATTAFAATSQDLRTLAEDARTARESNTAMAATLAGLTQKVEYSARVAARAHLPQLEQDLRTVRDARANIQREVDEATAHLRATRAKLAGERNGAYVLAAILLIGGLAMDVQCLAVIALVVWLGAWFRWLGKKAELMRLERVLFDETAPAFSELAQHETEMLGSIHEIRGA